MSNRLFPIRLLVVIGLSAVASLRAAAVDTTLSFHPGKIHILLVGDSTVTDDAGWGKGFAACLHDDVECINLSKGGRSSKSYIGEGSWKTALALKPDYVLIQFGHNDQPGHADRATDPDTTYRQYMTQYVDDARAANIKPVLVTSLSRRQWGEDGLIHSTLKPYADVVKQIASQKQVPVIDLQARSIAYYDFVGKQKMLELSPMKNLDPTSKNSDTASKQNMGYDGTHLNPKGSKIIGGIVACELKKAVPDLVSHISAPTTVIMSPDGSGDYKTLQEAFDAVPDNSPDQTNILLNSGTYAGQFILEANKNNVSLQGEDGAKSVLSFWLNVNEPLTDGTVQRYTGIGVVILGNDFSADNVTFQNTSGDHGQALALRIDGDRAVIKNCKLLGWQDTLRIDDNRQYFKDCYIEGRVDFIYGSAAAVFDQCEIHSKNGGHVTAANTPQDHPFGFVFFNCKLTGDPKPWIDSTGKIPSPAPALQPPLADLGRPWRPYASVTYINCEMGDHINPVGWNNWRNPANEKTARYAEYNSSGPGANPAARVPWSKQLTKDEAAAITIDAVLGGTDHWKPE